MTYCQNLLHNNNIILNLLINHFKESIMKILTILIALLSIFLTSFAESKWILLHNAKGNGADVYYDKQSIKTINDNVVEIYIAFATAYNKRCLEQIRIDCKNKKNRDRYV